MSPDQPPFPPEPSDSPQAGGGKLHHVTLRDIAQAVGVSPMTVSRALRSHSQVSTALRGKIQAKAEEMGYRPDPMLSALVHYRHGRGPVPVRAALAWLNPWPDPKQFRRFKEFDLYWMGASRAAEKLGFHLEEFCVNDSMKPERLASILSTRNVQGILLPPGPFAEGWLERFDWSRFSVVALTRNITSLQTHIVTADQMQNAMLAFDSIRERGYRRVGLASAGDRRWSFAAGYLWAQQWVDAEERIPPCLFHSQDDDERRKALSKWMKDHRPDAILTDVPALPDMLTAMGVRVPEDVGLAALSVLDCPIPAGIYQNAEDIGRAGVLSLASLINEGDRGMPQVTRKILVSGRWVDGASLMDRRQK